VIKDGGYYGMQTFDQSLLHLVVDGKVSVEQALEAASSPHDFKLDLQQEGIEIPDDARGV
jgi:twitching motility protein PilT